MTTQTGSRVGSMKHQAGHGFSRGQPVVFTGTSYALATAATGFNGIVGTIPDTNRFELVTTGELDGLAGLTPGQVLYLGPVAGVLATSGSTPALQANTAKTAWVLPAQLSSVASPDSIIAAAIAAAMAAHLSAGDPHSQYVLDSELLTSVTTILAGLGRDTRYVQTTPYGVLDVDDGELVWDVEDQTQVLDPVHA